MDFILLESLKLGDGLDVKNYVNGEWSRMETIPLLQFIVEDRCEMERERKG